MLELNLFLFSHSSNDLPLIGAVYILLVGCQIHVFTVALGFNLLDEGTFFFPVLRFSLLIKPVTLRLDVPLYDVIFWARALLLLLTDSLLLPVVR